MHFLANSSIINPAYPTHLLEHFFQCGVGPLLIHHGKEVLEELLALVEAYEYTDRVVLGVTDIASVIRAKERLTGVRVLGFIPDPAQIETFAEAGPTVSACGNGGLRRRISAGSRKAAPSCGS